MNLQHRSAIHNMQISLRIKEVLDGLHIANELNEMTTNSPDLNTIENLK